MKKYTKVIAMGALLAAGNLAYAVEPVALNAQDMDAVSAGGLYFAFADATNATTATSAGTSGSAAAALGGAMTGSGFIVPTAVAGGAGIAGAGGVSSSNVNVVNTAQSVALLVH